MKRIILVVMVVLAAVSLTGCGKKKKAQAAYDAIGDMSFADESVLSSEEMSRFTEMKERREKLLKKKDVKGLETLKEEWEEFSTPINDTVRVFESGGRSLFSETDYNYMTEEENSRITAYENRIHELYQNRDAAGLTEAIEEYQEYGEPLKEVITAYLEIIGEDDLSAADRNLMSDSDLTELQDITDSIEKAFRDRNLTLLRSLERTFDLYIEGTKRDLENAKDMILNKWIGTTDLTSTVSNLLSLGKTSTSTKLEGHTVIISTQYSENADVTDDEIRDALETNLKLISVVLQAGIDYLSDYVDDVCIRVEYLNAKGDVVAFKEYR